MRIWGDALTRASAQNRATLGLLTTFYPAQVRVKELITESASRREALNLLIERPRAVSKLGSVRQLESRAFAHFCAPNTDSSHRCNHAAEHVRQLQHS
mmetsp:Transcript_11316/g.34917  ORF Transcript_11316/g.34917 Transcript_11316/m.34917 type:complete len:98 (+) Transcript_11316:495-788(+)